MNEFLLDVKNVKKYFKRDKNVFFSKARDYIKAVDGVTLSIGKGEIFGLVGESGCGKTTFGKLILMSEKPTSGSIFFQGKDVQSFSKEELSIYRSSVHAMFQDPYGSLNPRMRVGHSVAEPLLENSNLSKQAIVEKSEEVFEEVGLSPHMVKLYPHQFSGGQRQRIALARALITRPILIVLDEPVSALDVSIRAQIMNLLMDLHQKLGLGYLLIAHDLSVVKHMSKRIGVMYVGKLVECAQSLELYKHPLHPYTRALLSAVLPPNPDSQRKVIVLPGEVPNPVDPPSGCRFHPRCSYFMPRCFEVEPRLEEVFSGHFVACHLYNGNDRL